VAKTPLKKAKDNAWSIFSLFIRTRDCLEYKKHHPELNNGLEAPCVTCGRVYPLKQLQAGHFIPSRTNVLLFDEKGVHVQCFGCNIRKSGNGINYFQYMENRYGRKMVDEMLSHRHDIIKYKAHNYEDIALLYKIKLSKLT
jgi:Bacteriophage Lambda NinG protein